MTRLAISLQTCQETADLGSAFATLFRACNLYPIILLKGPLGAGKTTFVQGLVCTLPGGRHAEVSSPSFNLVNIYPTSPETAHFDLYRIGEKGFFDESLVELLENEETFCLVEWSNFLPAYLLPPCYIELSFTIVPDRRRVEIIGHGDLTPVNLEDILDHLRK